MRDVGHGTGPVPRSDAGRSLWDSLDLGHGLEVGRYESDGRVLTIIALHNGRALRVTEPAYIIVNDADVAAQSVVLTTNELRWFLHHFTHPQPPLPFWAFWRDDLRALWFRTRKKIGLV